VSRYFEEVGSNLRRRVYRGDDYGGVSSMTDCEQLPENLQGGCYWRWNWAGGEITGWDVEYKEVECPARLTDISGCTPAPFQA